ncbi:MAG: hypothetical protein ABW163_02155, partial [Luteimonas sp.]
MAIRIIAGGRGAAGRVLSSSRTRHPAPAGRSGMDDRSRATVRGTPAARRVRGFALLLCVSIASVACQSHPSRPDNTVADWPLTFVQHNFGAVCYSTYGCTVDYNGYRHRSDSDDQLRPALSSVHPDILRSAPTGYLGILDLPPPATVRWRSRDGSR